MLRAVAQGLGAWGLGQNVDSEADRSRFVAVVCVFRDWDLTRAPSREPRALVVERRLHG